MVKQMYDHVRPGGYVEISEIEHDLRCDDGTMDGSNLKKYLDLFKASCMKAGQKFVDGEYTKKVMEDAGFVDVVVHTYILPWVSNVKLNCSMNLGIADNIV